ncbi:phosphoribosylaminoimidazolesuccinocarboxamide synthase [Candidatus Gottesmanbacteria bacterium]|nr:phosphoribosylaminoimidazolesuccinocarboxamide synthase [Candidatus Gottesmanbacteria bacterium]
MKRRSNVRYSSTKTLRTVNIGNLGRKYQGKVRDFYFIPNKRIIITTDRISAFDRVLGYIPYKGQVLNQLSAFWFAKTSDIVDNHLIDVIHPNVSVVHDAHPYPVEMIVRGFITGVTKTSIWYAYERGERLVYGIQFSEGLRKNEKLPRPIITPTTKAEKGQHDEKLTREEIIKRGLVPSDLYKKMERISLALFTKGQQICAAQGLILVDTKYEFADFGGKLMLIDEIHTPDSSRFWRKDSYRKRFAEGKEPENFDKEFFRVWYTKQGYRGDGRPPKMSFDLQRETSKRYIKIYELITGKKLKMEKYPLESSIKYAIKKYLT